VGNDRPRVARLADGSVVNAMGLPNPGAEAAAATLARAERTSPLVASIADEVAADALETHALLEPQVDAIELNVSCPNVSWGRDRDNEAHLAELLRRLASRQRPLFVKLPPFVSDVERDVVLALARIAVEGGADALTCSNTRPVTEPRLAAGRGGLSGRRLSAGTPRIVGDVVAAIDDAVPVNACGGIVSPADAVACVRAGARTLQLYTGLLIRGPAVVGELTRALAATASSATAGSATAASATASASATA
jgi:dihydroorotate dehydrogenase